MKRLNTFIYGIVLFAVIILGTAGIAAGISRYLGNEPVPVITESNVSGNPKISDEKKEILEIYFFDVGQADSSLIIFPDKKTMLIDAGESKTQNQIETDIRNLGIDRIDYLIATHPHADHIGGMRHIINSFEIGEIYMPQVSHTSATYENLLLAIAQKGLKVFAAQSGMQIFGDEQITVSIISPDTPDSRYLNDSSVVIRIKYHDFSAVFMGDAEEKAEKIIMDSGLEYSADIIKIGHHGSSTSSGEDFLRGVGPEIAIISVGTDNRYNHPSGEIINRLQNLGVKIFRTDLHGTIKVVSDGKNMNIYKSKPD